MTGHAMTDTDHITHATDKARIALNACDIETAQRHLDGIISDTDDTIDRDQWHDLAIVLRDAGMIEDALLAWQNAKHQGLESYVAELNSGATLIAGQRFDEAVGVLSPLREKHPKNTAIAHLLAVALFETGKHCEAIKTWLAALKDSAQIKCPFSTHPFYLSLAAAACETYLASHEAQEHTQEVSGTVERAPGLTVNARLTKIYSALEKNEPLRAMAWVLAEMKALGDDKIPENLELLYMTALGETGQWEKARECVTAYLKENGPEAMVESYFGLCLLRTGEAEMAARVLEQVEPYGPDDYMKNYYYACALMALDRRPEALLAFQVAFGPYFYDSYHGLVLPLWDKVKNIILNEEGEETHND